MTGPRLYVTSITGTRSIFPLTASLVKLGRNAENHVVLNDPSISRFHAEIRPQNSGFVIVDIGSKNGTTVNGERIREHKLVQGDRIQLGSNPIHSIVFSLQDLDEAALSVMATPDEASASKVSSHHLRMLLEVSKALSSSLVLNDVLNRVMDAVMELTGADRGVLMLRDASGELQFSMARSMSENVLEDKKYRLSRSAIQRVVDTGESVIVCDSERDQSLRDQKSVIALNLKTIMCVPLKKYRPGLDGSGPISGIEPAEENGRPSFSAIGLIYVDKQTVTQIFSPEDLELFETLVGHAGIAIENARLHQEEMEKHRLEDELKIAREIQQTLLPKKAPQLDHTRFAGINIPCRAIGGDYYDYMQLGEGRVGVVIADVSGKGPSAALLTSMVQGIFLAEASTEKSAATTVARVNHHLSKKNPSGKFVTVFYGIIDDTGCFSYCNAGHNPPLLVSAAGEVKELKEGGMVLGVFDGVPYEQGQVEWELGDRLIFFTDGVTEAQSTTAEDFGDERLIELVLASRSLSAEEMKEQVMHQLMEFTAGAVQHDDITLVVAERI